jgi:uncharacterized membrane protein
VEVSENAGLQPSLNEYKTYICAEILADSLAFLPQINGGIAVEVNEVIVNVNVIKKESSMATKKKAAKPAAKPAPKKSVKPAKPVKKAAPAKATVKKPAAKKPAPKPVKKENLLLK